MSRYDFIFQPPPPSPDTPTEERPTSPIVEEPTPAPYVPPQPYEYFRPELEIINEVQKENREAVLKVLATDTFIPLLYGRGFLQGKIACVTSDDQYLYMLFVFCLGEIHSFETIYINNKGINDPNEDCFICVGGEFRTYTGTQTQTPDPWFESLIPGYQDSLQGIAYITLKVPTEFRTVPTCSAVVRGKKVYNPLLQTIEFSDNPAYWMLDFITSTNQYYGMAREVDEASFIRLAEVCEEVLDDGVERRTGGYALCAKPTKNEDFLEVLRVLAGSFLYQKDFKYIAVPDRPVPEFNGYPIESSPRWIFTDNYLTSAFGWKDSLNIVTVYNQSFTLPKPLIYKYSSPLWEYRKINPDNILEVSSFKSKGLMETPTAVQVKYTNTSTVPWKTVPVWAISETVTLGSDSWRPSTYDLSGLINSSQAYRIAYQVMKQGRNDLTLELSCYFENNDVPYMGDIVEVTLPDIFENKLFRVIEPPSFQDFGKWKISLEEYDPQIYTDDPYTEPTYPDTYLPDPNKIPTVTNLHTEEVLEQGKDGYFTSKIKVSWDPVVYPYLKGYEVIIVNQGEVVDTGVVGNQTPGYISIPLEELQTYTVGVRVYSASIAGEFVYSSIYLEGKYAKPDPVIDFSGFESNGRVYLRWSHPPNDPDIRAYELRYYSNQGDWNNGEFITRVDALTYETGTIPPGDWYIGIKTIDSVGQYSDQFTEIFLSIVGDGDSIYLGPKDLCADPASTMLEILLPYSFHNSRVNRFDKYFVTSSEKSFSEMFPDPLSNYSDILVSYIENSGDQQFISEMRDYQRDLDGEFVILRDLLYSQGTISEFQEIKKEADSDFTQCPISCNTRARFQRYTLTTSGLGNVVALRGCPQGSMSTQYATESGEDVSSETAPTTITLSKSYVSWVDIRIIPQSSTPVITGVDNIDLTTGTFDVRIWDANNNNLISTPFKWIFTGI